MCSCSKKSTGMCKGTSAQTFINYRSKIQEAMDSHKDIGITDQEWADYLVILNECIEAKNQDSGSCSCEQYNRLFKDLYKKAILN